MPPGLVLKVCKVSELGSNVTQREWDEQQVNKLKEPDQPDHEYFRKTLCILVTDIIPKKTFYGALSFPGFLFQLHFSKSTNKTDLS
jgi:hypothetical protein